MIAADGARCPTPSWKPRRRPSFRATVGGEEVGSGTLTLRPEGDRELLQQIEGEAYGPPRRLASLARFRRRGGELLAAAQEVELRDRERELYSRERDLPRREGAAAGRRADALPARDGAGAGAGARAADAAAEGEGALRPERVADGDRPLAARPARREARARRRCRPARFDCWRIRLRPWLVDVAQALDELSANVVPPLDRPRHRRRPAARPARLPDRPRPQRPARPARSDRAQRPPPATETAIRLRARDAVAQRVQAQREVKLEHPAPPAPSRAAAR